MKCEEEIGKGSQKATILLYKLHKGHTIFTCVFKIFLNYMFKVQMPTQCASEEKQEQCVHAVLKTRGAILNLYSIVWIRIGILGKNKTISATKVWMGFNNSHQIFLIHNYTALYILTYRSTHFQVKALNFYVNASETVHLFAA